MGNQVRRHIGQILMDGGFLSKKDLDRAFVKQKHTRELLGQVLVRMGVLKARDIHAPLLVQEHLSSIDDAVKIAAGERQLLGALLVQSGRITARQLDQAIAEQKRSGEKLGVVFTRLGMLTERQLSALLEFQYNQEYSHIASPLRLGELLLATGYISRDQLEDALQKQSISHKKIGEVLVEEGYVSQSRIKSGFRLQKMLTSSVLAAILSLGVGATSYASSVQLQWDANTETDLAGYKVYHNIESSPLAGTVPLDVSKLTTATISGLDPDKAYTFAVTAYNDSGVESSYSNIVSVAEQTPPAIAILTPADAASVSGTVSVSVNATDNVGVTKVEFYVNGGLKSSDIGAPYLYLWDTTSLTPGAYTLMVKAYDAAGNVSQSSRTVTVVNDLIAPIVALTSPANSATISSGTVTISASASDNVGVTMVEFYCNNVLLYASNVSPYSYNWDTKGVGNGNYTILAMAYDNAGYFTQSTAVTVTVSNPVPDVIAPTVASFTMPTTSASLTVAISAFTASDAVGVTGYLITESATAPAATATGWTATKPDSYRFSSAGAKTAYAWARDAAGNVSASRSASVSIAYEILGTDIAPLATVSASSENISTGQLAIKAVDTFKTGYPNDSTREWATLGQLADAWIQLNWLQPYSIDKVALYDRPNSSDQILNATLTFSDGSSLAVGPLSNDGSAVIYTFPSKTVTWVKMTVNQANGSNIGLSEFEVYGVSVNDTVSPIIATFTLPTTATSLTVPVSGLSASDGFSVTGYLITESATAPTASATGWSATAPTSFIFSAEGARTAYAWAKDAAGNVSSSRSASVTITLADTAAPTVASFSLPTTATSLTVPVSGLTASDNNRVTGYLITESASAPSASAAGWKSSAPTSFTFRRAGAKTAYAWAKNAAGKVSTPLSASVTITLPVKLRR